MHLPSLLRVLLVTAFVTAPPSLHGQAPAAARPVVAGIGEIRGRIVDSASQKPVTSGSITVRRAGDSSFAGGSLPRPDGTFRVDGLVAGRYSLRIRALGFGQVIRGDLVISANKPVVDVGAISLNTVAAKLEGQDVVAEREETVVAPDRNSYSTKNMTTASGGTAIDVLRNIPQVEVDGANKVSLRSNDNVVIQINGRSSPLKGEQLGAFLAQLPAGTVKTVEVATNPSAKNDPEGTAGIINIVLNQETELGLSGGLNAGTSSTGQVNAGGNVGKQMGAFTLFLSGNMYRDRRVNSGTISRENLVIPVPVYVETRTGGTQRPLSGGGTLRSEYRFNEKDALAFDGFFYGGRYGGNNASYYTDLDNTRSVIGLFNQFNEQLSHNFSQDYSVAFRRQGPPTTTQFSSEIEYSNNYNTNDVNLSGELIRPDASTPSSIPREFDHTIGHFPTWNLKTDYTRPFSIRTNFRGAETPKGMKKAPIQMNT